MAETWPATARDPSCEVLRLEPVYNVSCAMFAVPTMTLVPKFPMRIPIVVADEAGLVNGIVTCVHPVFEAEVVRLAITVLGAARITIVKAVQVPS